MKGDWYNKMTKEMATERANKLKNRLDIKTGGKWKIRVHENAGWHFNVYCGTVSVTQYEPKRYTCLISDGEYAGTGCGIWTLDDTSAPTPEECVRKNLEYASKVISEYNIALSKNYKLMPLIK